MVRMLVVVDLGNSMVKLGAFEDGRLIATERFEGGPAIADGVIPSPYVARADEVVVASSAPAQLPLLLRALERSARVLGSEIVRAVETSYEHADELGIDRLAAAWGARALTGGGAVIVVDVGTAVTVDALDALGRFVAVAIAPGVHSAADGLARAAPHLPRVAASGDAVPKVPALGTADSLRNGILLGMAGLVERLVAAARAEVGGDAPVVLTGGGALTIAKHLEMAHRVELDCVLHGLRALHAAIPAPAESA